MGRRVMITALARAMKASMTRVRRSVQTSSFVKPRLCHELVRSTTHRAPACRGKPFLEMTPSQPSSVSRSRVLAESYFPGTPGSQAPTEERGDNYVVHYVTKAESRYSTVAFARRKSFCQFVVGQSVRDIVTGPV